MKEKTLDELVDNLKWAKEYKYPSPIFLLGAGASKTGLIPLANEIVNIILDKFKNFVSFKNLSEDKKNYQDLMRLLTSSQIKEIYKPYIEKSKINITYIYLAHLLYEGYKDPNFDYLDYIFTTNFDNLMIKALGLYNLYPPIYDIAPNIDLTTTTIEEKSIVYLHGLYPGIQLLNTSPNLENPKIIENIKNIFRSVTNKRPWIIIGYSGSDPVFDRINELGKFDNNLYWVLHKDENPNEKVLNFLKDEQKNAFVIKGYDSDTFMMNLNNKLGLKQPLILEKPFTALKNNLDGIVDIIDSERFALIKEPLEKTYKNVKEVIKKYEPSEESKIKEEDFQEKNENIKRFDNLKKQIIDLILLNQFNEEKISKLIKELDEFKKIKPEEINESLYSLFFNWAYNLSDQAQKTSGKEAENLFKKAIEKYEKAIELKPDYADAYNNLGIVLNNFAMKKEGKEAEDLFKKAIGKSEKAIELKPDYAIAYTNLGFAFNELGKLKDGKEAEDLFTKAIEKYEKAIELKPDDADAYNNLGIAFNDLGKLKDGKEAEDLFKKAIEKFEKAIELKPDYANAFSNLAILFLNLFHKKSGKEAEEVLIKAEEVLIKAVKLDASHYNLACLYSLKRNKSKALELLDLSLKNKEITKDHALNDPDWKHYLNDDDFINVINKY